MVFIIPAEAIIKVNFKESGLDYRVRPDNDKWKGGKSWKQKKD